MFVWINRCTDGTHNMIHEWIYFYRYDAKKNVIFFWTLCERSLTLYSELTARVQMHKDLRRSDHRNKKDAETALLMVWFLCKARWLGADVYAMRYFPTGQWQHICSPWEFLLVPGTLYEPQLQFYILKLDSWYCS